MREEYRLALAGVAEAPTFPVRALAQRGRSKLVLALLGGRDVHVVQGV